MALVKCGECGKDVSTKAASCPNCGAPVVPARKPGHIGTGTGCIIILATTVCLVIMASYISAVGRGYAPPPNPEPQRLAAYRESKEPNQKEIELFREIVATVGRDGVIAKLTCSSNSSPWRLTITVNEWWNAMPYGTRFEYAKTFRGAWSGIFSPEKSSITIVDGAGRTIGEGSWSEDAIWVY